MKINRFGMNLDEGIPLSKEQDFQKLYVPCFEDMANKLRNWITDDLEKKPLMFGGQIGSGESTLIAKILLKSPRKPDITLYFDKEGLNLDIGDFLSITLVGFIKKAMDLDMDLSFSKLPAELFKLEVDDWRGIVNLLSPKEFSMKSFGDKSCARKKVSEHSIFIKTNISKIGLKIQEVTKKPLFIFASGIDKYDNASPAFFSLKESLNVISQFKTLYEVNATHFFLPQDSFKTENKLLGYSLD